VEDAVEVEVVVHIGPNLIDLLLGRDRVPVRIFKDLVELSGEDIDLLFCGLPLLSVGTQFVADFIKDNGIRTIAIVNVSNSLMAREADYVVELGAGREVAVASTKAYSAQVVALSMLAKRLINESILVDNSVLEQVREILLDKFSEIAEAIIGHKSLVRFLESAYTKYSLPKGFCSALRFVCCVIVIFRYAYYILHRITLRNSLI